MINLRWGERWPPAELNAALLGGLDSSLRPLDDQPAFEFSQSAHNVSARAPIMCMTRRPPELEVSIGSDRLRKLIPRAPSSAMSVTK